MKYEIKNYVVITVLLIGFAGIATATASKLASATPATSPAPTMITQPTQSGEVQSIYENHRLQIGENIKNLVILIPNEGHMVLERITRLGSWISHLFLKLRL